MRLPFGLHGPTRMNHSAGKPWRESDWVLLSQNWRWSITWSWALYWNPPRERGRFWSARMNHGYGHISWRLPLLGGFGLHWQPTMPEGNRFHLWKLGKLHYLSLYADHRLTDYDHVRLGKRWAWVRAYRPQLVMYRVLVREVGHDFPDLHFVDAASAMEAMQKVARNRKYVELQASVFTPKEA